MLLPVAPVPLPVLLRVAPVLIPVLPPMVPALLSEVLPVAAVLLPVVLPVIRIHPSADRGLLQQTEGNCGSSAKLRPTAIAEGLGSRGELDYASVRQSPTSAQTHVSHGT